MEALPFVVEVYGKERAYEFEQEIIKLEKGEITSTEFAAFCEQFTKKHTGKRYWWYAKCAVKGAALGLMLGLSIKQLRG